MNEPTPRRPHHPPAVVLERLRREWLNLHVGGFHWIHNFLTDVNLLARHSCQECADFRDQHWPREPFLLPEKEPGEPGEPRKRRKRRR
jgi:hypothetical protein